MVIVNEEFARHISRSEQLKAAEEESKRKANAKEQKELNAIIFRFGRVIISHYSQKPTEEDVYRLERCLNKLKQNGISLFEALSQFDIK